MAVSKTTKDDYLFRTYGLRAKSENCSVLDACLATSAATTFFSSITINGVEYVDGAFGQNNPSIVALRELESDNWFSPMGEAEKEVGCLVSIGTGIPTFTPKKGWKAKLAPRVVKSVRGAADICIDIATDCHRKHLTLRDKYVN